MASKDDDKKKPEGASYQGATHRPPPRAPAPPVEPPVIVDRPMQPPTLRIDKSQLPAFPPIEEPTAPSARAVSSSERTFMSAPKQGRRVVIALFSAVLVVFAIFVAMKMWVVSEKKKAVGADPHASELIDGSAPPPKTWTPRAGSSATPAAPPAASLN